MPKSNDPLGDALRGSLSRGISKAFQRPRGLSLTGGTIALKAPKKNQPLVTPVQEPSEPAEPRTVLRKVTFVLPKSDRPKRLSKSAMAKAKKAKKRLKKQKQAAKSARSKRR